MSNENQLPELLSPPFWGNSDLLTFNVDSCEVRTLYCYFPVFTNNGTIIVVDPYEPTNELTTITPTNNEIAERFIVDGDLLAVCAVSKPESYSDKIGEEVIDLLKSELRKGLQIPQNRGELLSTEKFAILSKENKEALEALMTYEDRLGYESSQIEVFLFIHNSQEA